MALVFWILVRKGTSELTGNRTCKYNVQVNVDVSTTGIRLSRLSCIVSKSVLVITTEWSLPQDRAQGARVERTSVS